MRQASTEAETLSTAIGDARRRVRDLKQPPDSHDKRRGHINTMRRDLLLLRGDVARAKNVGKVHRRRMLSEIRGLLAALDGRPDARARREQAREQQLVAARRRALESLRSPGPGGLRYERRDPGGKLDENGRAKTTAPVGELKSVSIRALGGGLPGLGRGV
ncbi:MULTISPECIES: hypothetical protein [Nocardiaceae]|uniref:CHAD domain-containing protein n=1 Tax=Rhodococcoides kroppenstedtii TaxID=293050 RepID=A0ABS7NWS0_9NOCA|nr:MULTISPECIES: hypothetical protein [Rhodococcus]MBY6314692.1 hypothetical protein [Rhodococcus kroppenstedtii]MBY6322499.1 hypothetical protein [Rhodococcus kroppenstedtii]MBY6401303.1 hypothetical protein [Rhodococcus kroppenstedtii]